MFISGELARRVALATTLVATLSLSACGGDDPKDPAPGKTAIDKAAQDKKALETLANDLWQARTAAYNAGNVAPEQFERVLSLVMTEVELSQLKSYQKLKVRREGEPKLTDIETTASGDTGEILLCFNEDDWIFTEDGKPLPPRSDGFKPWGAKAERTAKGWIVTEYLKTDVVRKKKTC